MILVILSRAFCLTLSCAILASSSQEQQPTSKPFDVVNVLPYPDPRHPTADFLFDSPEELAWKEILQRQIGGIDLAHASKAVVVGLSGANRPANQERYTICRRSPMPPSLHSRSYLYVSDLSLATVTPKSLLACADVGRDPDSAAQEVNYSGALAAVPDRRRAYGFVLSAPHPLNAILLPTHHEFSATIYPADRSQKAHMTLTYTAPSRPPLQSDLDTNAKTRLRSWRHFRIGHEVYIVAVWDGDSSSCQTFTSLYHAGAALESLAEGGYACDV